MSSHFDFKSSTQTDLKVTGGGLALDLLLGTTIVPGLAVGAAILTNSSQSASDKKVDSTKGLNQVLLGPFVDGFPDPTGAQHRDLARLDHARSLRRRHAAYRAVTLTWRARSMLAPGTRPRLNPWRRNTLASPCHSA